MTFSTEAFLMTLTEDFPGFSFRFKREENFVGKIPVFFVNVYCDEETLAMKWSDIVGRIAVDFQTQLEDNFSIWNVYLFFITIGTISDGLKYQIENDTFSSRKIVIESDIPVETIIAKHIRNDDLDISRSSTNSSKREFEAHPILWELLKTKQANQRLVQEDREIFKKFVQRIKIEAHEDSTS